MRIRLLYLPLDSVNFFSCKFVKNMVYYIQKQ